MTFYTIRVAKSTSVVYKRPPYHTSLHIDNVTRGWEFGEGTIQDGTYQYLTDGSYTQIEAQPLLSKTPDLPGQQTGRNLR